MNQILLLIEHQQNRHLLSQWLAETYQVLLPKGAENFVSEGEKLLAQPFDLCLLDLGALRKLKQQMLARRGADPVFLPFAFITDRQDIGISSDHLESLIDDVIHVPVSQKELQTRLRVLMRSRSASLQLQEAKEQVNRALERERELNKLKSHFVSIVSHEFRNPLNSISGMAQILESYGDKLAPAKKARVFEQLQQNIFKMTALLDDVLIVSRSDLGKLEFNPVSLELPAFCRSAIAEVKSAFDSKIRIDFVYQAERQQFELDRQLLERILSNLLSNACKYSPQDSVVEFKVGDRANKIVFIVSDRGMGIPDEDLDKLFAPFYRASNSDNTQGTGLGLTIVKQCVELHQGEIAVESQLGRGTTFIVSLPYS